jgi:hypothetical protein
MSCNDNTGVMQDLTTRLEALCRRMRSYARGRNRQRIMSQMRMAVAVGAAAVGAASSARLWPDARAPSDRSRLMARLLYASNPQAHDMVK